MTLLSKLLNAIFTAKSTTKAFSKTRIPENVIDEAIEHVVDSIEPKMRYYPGYKKIIKQSVLTTLAYISNLVETIPGPLIINSKTFTTDPQVKAYFPTIDRIQEIFSDSSELKNFFEAPDKTEQQEAYALLCMNVEEKTVPGMELNNDVIRRDVMQTLLNFSEHKILSPATNEADVRKGIKQCIFNCLITYALQEILDIKEKKLGLELKRKKLSSRLKARQSQGGGLSSLLTSATENKAPDNIKQELTDNTKKLEKLPSSWDAPRYYLESIKNTLSQPESFISIQDMTYDITKMGIVNNGDTTQKVNTIHVNKILIANVLQRAVAIVRYSRSDLLPRREFSL